MRVIGRRRFEDWGGVVWRLVGRRGAMLAPLYIMSIALTAALAPVIPGIDPLGQDLSSMLEPSSGADWFGTDELGRDLMSRTGHGARISLLTAAGAVILAAALGVPIGLVAGFFGGWRDAVLMRAVDVLLALPGILLAMARCRR